MPILRSAVDQVSFSGGPRRIPANQVADRDVMVENEKQNCGPVELSFKVSIQ